MESHAHHLQLCMLNRLVIWN